MRGRGAGKIHADLREIAREKSRELIEGGD